MYPINISNLHGNSFCVSWDYMFWWIFHHIFKIGNAQLYGQAVEVFQDEGILWIPYNINITNFHEQSYYGSSDYLFWWVPFPYCDIDKANLFCYPRLSVWGIPYQTYMYIFMYSMFVFYKIMIINEFFITFFILILHKILGFNEFLTSYIPSIF